MERIDHVNVADEALEAVRGDRQEAYGHPYDNHGATAKLWNAYLERRFGHRFALDAEDVCWLNVLQKVGREAHLRRRDNVVDVIGYALNVELVQDTSSVPFVQAGS